ncbi:GMC family oxidoreductase [Maritalea mediterranea]|uniref:GMC family oxidoreductase N-terminal domain-containing protein n=1 Tax=Maritalea mediterranea TaxID=2909667 RepID=A0ABS9E6I1_9HYPH|nr:GMC family oxidoreductase N-terminal domain-containing protein [Maritalea mediterranea]MCF4098479.1 GMC family oxidoreductase N-terminal domain-containing protein [Maritalea mediterranea]
MDEAINWDGQFDFVIVGGGTAGCVLANRLSANPNTQVLLLEAGGHDNYHWVHIPVGYLYCIGNPRTDWMMKTASEPGLNGRRLVYPRGKLLGGCTSINGMIYMRGQAADYDHWRQLGNKGWGWEDVLPYFQKSEDYHDPEAPLHGTGGEWKVTRQRLKWEILDAVQDAAAEKGIMPRKDFNDGSNEGSGFFDVNQKDGVRWNTAKAFLKPAQKRPNLTVLTKAHTHRVIFEGQKAVGVEYDHRGQSLRAQAGREVIVAAGAINSPKLLELSGVGNPDLLRDFDIEMVHANKGVGENLQDHLQIRTVYRVEGAKTLNKLANSFWGKLKMGLEYGLKQSGPLSMAPSQFGMFTKSAPHLDTPDLEYHVQPLSTDKLGDPLHDFPAITMSVCNLRPQSVGASHINSTDTKTQPHIQLNYLSADADRQVALKAVRQARDIMTASALQKYQPTEILPGLQVDSDAELLEKIGDIATTIFHPVGTCKMGQDAEAVVDDQLRVHGVQNLRVVDASIMPKITSGNTASPVIMIAEKASDLILAAQG